ncbi:MAG: helix-turn-helix transcriptional regulator [Spirochaetales bacterium]|nr:helix-turn-helix transcriptional regulator [Spirochaetales bacterium]
MNDKCNTIIVHQEIVDKVLATTPPQETLYELADFFKVLGDSTRMKILYALLISEMCVCDLSIVTEISQSAVSHQLKVLRQARLVKFRREGKSVFYSLNDEHVKQILSMGKEHIEEK